MKRVRMNKKGLEDSLFTWIAAILIILFFLLIYLVLVFIILGADKAGGIVKQIVGSNAEEDLFKNLGESNVDLVANSKFLDFLNTEVVLDNGLHVKVVDLIKTSEPENDDNFKLIMNRLEDGCSMRSLFLEVPQGIITIEGLVIDRKRLDLTGTSNPKGGPPYYYYDSIIHKNVYKGENIVVRSGIVSGKLNSRSIDLWGNCK